MEEREMRRMRLSFISRLAVVSLLIVWPLHVWAASYTFTKIADTSGPYSQFDVPGAPSVNNAGTVTFLAGLDAGAGAGGIFTGDGGLITTIADSAGPFVGIGSLGQYPSISARGTVVFLGDLDTGPRGIFTGDGGPLTTIVLEPRLKGLGHPSINDGGIVAFTATAPEEHVDIFTSRHGSLTPIIHNRGTFTGINERLSINDAGTVAFLASVPVGSPGIFTVQRGSITTIVDTSGPFTALGSPSINNAGTVAFFGCLDALNPSC